MSSTNNTNSASPPPPPASVPPPPQPSTSSPPPESSPPPPPSSDSSPSPENSSQSPPPPPKDSKSPPPPPPPPPRSSSHRRSPPPPLSLSDNGYSGNNNGSSTNNKSIIAGAIIGGGLLLILMIIICVACNKKKRRKPHDQMLYYRDNSTGSDYYKSVPRSNWNNNNEHAIKIPQEVPPPSPPGHVSSEQWPVMPPPPPPAMSSSEMSSAEFSSGAPPPLPPPSSLSLGFNQSRFMPEDLALATGGYAKANLLGQGGFGYVYKGVLPNGKEVAVKSLKAGSGQGDREFQAEVEIISRVHHRHLVTLVGYCIAGDQRMLVYEFIPNNSLEYHLHGQAVIDFPSRLKIALGSAKGFAYLHEDCHPRIIHRDIKAANILLDYNYEAKVADFGLAKLSNDSYTHVSTRIMGTFGYLAPEYASSGKLTEKSDVYSYGIVLLELITGKRPVDVHSDDDSLVDWARPILEQAVDGEEYEELVDPRLNDEYDHHEMLRMIACANACLRHSARRRPRMIQIVRALEGDASLEDLNEGMKKSSSAVFSSTSSEFDGSYNSQMRKFRKNNASQEFTSNEYRATGEFFIQPSPLRSVGDSQEFIRRLHL